jgi:hypothetical protein
MAPATARVFHSHVASPQPNSPSMSVSTRTKIQFRISALTIAVETRVIRMTQVLADSIGSPVALPSSTGIVISITTGTAAKSNRP